MNDARYLKKLEENIYKNYILQIVHKRAYLPLIAIYAVNVANVSLYQLGIVASITAVVSLILEVPSGYIADRIGHKNALVFGTLIETASPLLYVLSPNFLGVLLGSVLFFGGGAFISGTKDAFMHETLLELGRENEYTKMAGLAQTYGLLGNVVFISIIPLTYPIDVRLPFLIGFALLLLGLITTASFTTPIKTKKSVAELESISFYNLLRRTKDGPNYLLFILLGIITATNTKVPEFREIYFQSINIPVIYFGFILAISSLAGAAISYNVHKFDAVKPKSFYLADILIALIAVAAIGLTHNPWLGALLFIALTAYSRNRGTLITSYVLADSPTRELKATYLSILAFFEALSGIWIPLLLGYLVGSYGIHNGYWMFSAILAAPVLLLYSVYLKKQKNSQKPISA